MKAEKKQAFTLDLAGKPLTLETGQLAKQATSSVLARMGDTMVLVTVVEGKLREDLGYFPLTVEYVERLYAGGKIKGSRWVKREGRPSDEAILTGRLIDRSIRPLFPKEYKKEVQIVITVLSVDGEHETDVLAIVGVSAALAISPIPWNGPVAAIRMGYVKDAEGKNEYLVNPNAAETELSDLDLVVTQTKEKTLMLEAGAKQVNEGIAFEAIKKAHESNKEIIAFIEGMVKKIGQPKTPVTPDNALHEMVSKIEKSYKTEIESLVKSRASKESSGSEAEELINKIAEDIKMADPDADADKKLIAKAVEYVSFKSIRSNVLKNGKRVDGRKVDEIRPISVETGLLPRTHGSAIFQRGDTQALTIATLGSPRLGQLIESAEGEETKRYMHHYSMPPYSVGETGRMGVPSRREIGHGALAERALIPVIPSQDKFPYAIRVVSEILSSNGSTSMASTCGSTLALMDAGVPIEKPVAGIAMGMMSNEDKHVVLTDILGLEDFSGDMDFKVAGTDSGITAIQLDVKISGLTDEQIKETFARAKVGRLYILEKMLSVMPEPRKEISEFAPKIEQIKIPVEKIGEVIGPGGKVIKNIIAVTGAVVDVEDDGTVTISGTDPEGVRKATDWVKGLVREVVPGEEFEGSVKRILPFGAFVEFLPGKEGMVHVSQMSEEYVKDPNDVVKIGQVVKVKVLEIDDQGRINLTMKMNAVPGEGGRRGGGERRGESGGSSWTPRPGAGEDRDQERTGAKPHPLSMQFRRERAQQQGGNTWQRGGSRGGRPGGYQQRSPSGYRRDRDR